jgi:hypothetical protein
MGFPFPCQIFLLIYEFSCMICKFDGAHVRNFYLEPMEVILEFGVGPHIVTIKILNEIFDTAAKRFYDQLY